MADMILVINAGSSSIKFSVYLADGASDLVLTLKGQVGMAGQLRWMLTLASHRPLISPASRSRCATFRRRRERFGARARA